jgi:hypothetical protein
MTTLELVVTVLVASLVLMLMAPGLWSSRLSLRELIKRARKRSSKTEQ